MRVLSLHSDLLRSQFRGPFILNDADADAKAKADADAKAKADGEAKEKSDKEAKDKEHQGRISELAEKNKELQKQLKEFTDGKKSEEEEKLKKKGDHEKIIAERDTQLTNLGKVKESLASKLALYEEDAKKRIEESVKGITDADKKKTAEAMLKDRPIEEQIRMLPEILKLVGQQSAGSFGGATMASTTTATKGEVEQKKARYQELLGKANPTPAERAETHKLMVELEKVWNEEHAKK